MAEEKINKMTEILNRLDQQCQDHYVDNKTQTDILITSLDRNLKSMNQQLISQKYVKKHIHQCSQVDEVDKEDQSQTQIQPQDFEQDEYQDEQQLIENDQNNIQNSQVNVLEEIQEDAD